MVTLSSELRQSHTILQLHRLRIRGALLQLPHTSPFARSLIDGDSFVRDSDGTYSISVMAVCVNFMSEAGDKICSLSLPLWSRPFSHVSIMVIRSRTRSSARLRKRDYNPIS